MTTETTAILSPMNDDAEDVVVHLLLSPTISLARRRPGSRLALARTHTVHTWAFTARRPRPDSDDDDDDPGGKKGIGRAE